MLLTPLLDLLAPHRCVTCAVRADPPWCPDCARAASAFSIDPATACGRCAGPVGRHACWRGPSPVSALVAHYRYRGPVADAIVTGKARGVRGVWPVLGTALGARVDAQPVDVVTWVPAPAGRRRRRGFDHAELLAAGLASTLRLPAASLLDAHPRLPDRGQADAPDRGGIGAGAYRTRGRLDGARVLVVDDVLTTGSTVRSVARAVRLAGAADVRAAVVARAGAHPLATADDRPAAQV